MKNLDLVILAGGKGSRIRKYLSGKPKPMIKFKNIFFLQYLINMFSKYPFRTIYILVGYKSSSIIKKFHNKIFNFSKVICIKEKKLMDTGGSLLGLKKRKLNNFILANGDTIFDVNIKDLIKSCKKNKIGSLALIKYRKNFNNQKLNNLVVQKNVLNYKREGKLMNGGVYFFKKKFLKYLPNKKCSLENEILPSFIKKKLITGKVFNNFFIDIGTPKYLKISKKKIINYFSRPAVFLDRDGVINHDLGYVHKKKDFIFKKGVIEGLKFLNRNNYYIFLVTNQAGIAKGIFTENDFFQLHNYIKDKLFLKNIFFSDVQYSPYHPKGKIKKYKKYSSMRKPNNQMIKNIFNKFLIKKNKSFMIGDKISDKKCAEKSSLFFFYSEKNFLAQIKKIIRKI